MPNNTYKEIYAILVNNEKCSIDDRLKQLDFLDKEKEELLKRKIKKILEQGYQLEQMGNEFKQLKSLEHKNKLELQERMAKKNNNGYIWVTINPKADVPLSKFIQKVQKISNYSCFRDTTYVFEQRGTIEEGTTGKGFHAHILAKRNLNVKPSKCHEKVRRGCKTLVNDINNNIWINIVTIGDDYALDKQKYILGAKTVEKQAKQKADVVWRKKNKLKTFYKKLSK